MSQAFVQRCMLSVMLLATAVGCGRDSGEPDGPDPDPIGAILTIGDTLTGTIAPGDSASWVYYPTVAEELALFFTCATGGGELRLATRIIGEGRWAFVDAGAPPPMLLNRTDRIDVPAGDTVSVKVLPYQGVGCAYRMFAYKVDRRPEHGPAQYELDNLRTERLENSADIDEFDITTAEPAEIVGFLRTPAAPIRGQASLYVDLLSFDNVPSAAGSESIEDLATRTVAVGAGLSRVRVVGVSGAPQDYEFRVRRVRRNPEQAEQELTAGRGNFGESIDHIGDIDEYTLVGPPGELANFHFAAPPAGNRALYLSTFGDGVVEKQATLLPTRTTASSGRVVYPPSGRIRVRVALPYPDSLAPGPYTITQDLMSPLAENGRALVPGDSVINESIEREGDTDLYPFTLATASALNLFLRRTTGTPGDLDLEVWPASDTTAKTTLRLRSHEATIGTGARRFAAGPWMARVLGADGHREPALFTGAYRLHAYRIDSVPEISPSSAMIGSVLQDAIDPTGDVDTFALAGQAGDIFRLRLTVPGTASASAIWASWLDRTPGAPPPFLVLAGAPFVTAEGAVSQPIEMGTSGPHRLEVKSTNEGQVLGGTEGAYTLRVEAVPVTPESNPATVGINATISETLTTGDIDEYTIAGSPDQEVAFYLSGSMNPPLTGGPPGYLCAEFMDPGTSVRRGGVGVGPNGEGSGPVRLGASGNLRVRLWPVVFSCPTQPHMRVGTTQPGSYTLAIRPVVSAPETAPAALIVTDTVRTEAVDHPADVDLFSFSGVAGQQVLLAAWQAQQPSLVQMNLHLTIIAPNGAVVSEVRTLRSTNTWLRAAPVTLPATGTFSVRVEVDGRREGSGAYRFTLAP